jgi:hypothetical protein
MKQIQMVCLAFLLCCGVVCSGAFAQAQVTGSGTTNYLPVWTSSSVIGNSRIYEGGSNIGVNMTSPQYSLDVGGHINSSAGYLIGENLVLATPNGTTNLAVGYEALLNNTGDYNTATGGSALQFNTSGEINAAHGYNALAANTTGSQNSAYGAFALVNNTTASYNTAVGAEALFSTNGSQNTAVGAFALNHATGSSNVAIGYEAGISIASTSNNIDIANAGASADSGTVRFGTAGQQTSFFAAGIRGVTTGENNAIEVVIDSNGQLGTVSSSRRFKTDIHDMGEASRGLLRLRPVTFRYRKPFADGSQPVQYGLIAEEVAEVYPDLVAYGNDGQPESVKYQVLDSLLLNEVQRQQTEIQELRQTLTRVEALLNASSPAAQVRPTRGLVSGTAAAQVERQ